MRVPSFAAAALVLVLVLAPGPAAAQDWFSFSGQYNGAAGRCSIYTVDVPEMTRPWNTRVSVTFTTFSAATRGGLWFKEETSEYGHVSGTGGYLFGLFID